MEASFVLQRLGLALLLGLLVGLQREKASSHRLAGFRTFALITVFGGLCGALTAPVGPWVVPAGLLGIVGLVVVGNAPRVGAEPHGPGITSEVAMLLMFGVGAVLMLMPPAIGVCLGGATAVLLQLKTRLHAFAKQLTEQELRAIMQFALISAVILPVAPDRAYDRYGALNPRHIWLMVALITGISLAGYLTSKFVPSRTGALLAGALGGLISSTATAVSFGRRSAGATGPAAGLAAVVIGVACTIMYGRLMAEVAALSPALVASAAMPIGAMAAATALGSLAMWLRARRAQAAPMPAHGNPAELKAALFFGASYALIAFVAAWGKESLGESALYPIALLSGATEMDAITLSIARLTQSAAIEPAGAWRYLVVAAIANTAFKWAAAGILGGRPLALRLAPALGGSILTGGAFLALWR